MGLRDIERRYSTSPNIIQSGFAKISFIILRSWKVFGMWETRGMITSKNQHLEPLSQLENHTSRKIRYESLDLRDRMFPSFLLHGSPVAVESLQPSPPISRIKSTLVNLTNIITTKISMSGRSICCLCSSQFPMSGIIYDTRWEANSGVFRADGHFLRHLCSILLLPCIVGR